MADKVVSAKITTKTISITSVTVSAGTATVTVPSHGLIVGQQVLIAGGTAANNGLWNIVSVPTVNTLTITSASMVAQGAVGTLSSLLELNDDSTYRVADGSFENQATQHRRKTATNPFIEGEYVVSSLRGNITEQVNVYVKSDSQYVTRAAVKLITDALEQPTFTFIASVDNWKTTWTCYSSDYTLSSSKPLLHSSMVQVQIQLLRDPVEVVGFAGTGSAPVVGVQVIAGTGSGSGGGGDAAAALAAANAAQATANTAVTNAATALSTATTALSTANTANTAATAVTYLSASSYAGYDSADSTVAMTAWFQAFLDAKAQNATLIVPIGRFQVSAAFNTTATSGTLAASSAAGATITVASTAGLPAAGPFKIILEPNTTSGVSEVVTVTSYAGLVLTLAARTAGTAWEAGKAHGATYTVARSLPMQSGTTVKGIVPMRGEATPCELQVFGSHYFAGFGANGNVQGVFCEDVGFWSSENATTTVARAFMFPGSAATFKDSIFSRCAWKWFTQTKFLAGRSRMTQCYFNNGFSYNTAGTRLTPSNEGLVHFGGSDNFLEHIYIDTWFQGIPSDQSIVKIDGFAESTVDFMYITPGPGRPIEVTGYGDGLVLNFLVNGLGEHNTRQSLGISPASFGTAVPPTLTAAQQTSLRGWLYEKTDTGVVSRWDGSSYQTIVDNTTLVTGSPFATRASLTSALAAANTRRWATVSDATDLSGIRSYYSDGVRWRGPHFDSPGPAPSPASGYLGADYGVWFHDIRGVVQVNSMSLRSVAQFDSAFPGSVRVENATVQIGNLSLWSSGSTTPTDIYVNNGAVELGHFSKDGAPAVPITTLVGTGRVATSPATLGGVAGQLLRLNNSFVPVPDDFLHAALHGPGGTDRTVIRAGHESANRAETIDRYSFNGQTSWPSSGTTADVRFTYFTSNINKTINRFRTFSGTTAYAAGTGGPHQTRLGLYTVAANGDLTLVARTSQGLRWTTTNAVQEDALDTTGGYPASYDLLYGARYAIGIIYNVNGATSATAPDVMRYQGSGPNSTARSLLMSYSPRMSGVLAAQTDLPTTLTAATVTNYDTLFYVGLYNSADSGV
jgi:hypothetical protein